MPTYQYRCADCAHFFEIVQSFSDDSLTECPECRGALRKVFNAVGVVFKGSGFYKNDSRGTSSASSAGSSGSSGGESTTTPEKKSDAKPEKKAESKPAPAAAASSSD